MYSTSKITSFSFLVLFVLLVSCSNDKKKSSTTSKLEIKDDFNLLSDETKNYLRNSIKFPDDILVLVRTVERIELSKLGSYASSHMEKEDWWKEVNPKGVYKRWIKTR